MNASHEPTAEHTHKRTGLPVLHGLCNINAAVQRQTAAGCKECLLSPVLVSCPHHPVVNWLLLRMCSANALASLTFLAAHSCGIVGASIMLMLGLTHAFINLYKKKHSHDTETIKPSKHLFPSAPKSKPYSNIKQQQQELAKLVTIFNVFTQKQKRVFGRLFFGVRRLPG